MSGKNVDSEGHREQKVAFVFAGGSSLGAIEVGMLKAIMEKGIKPDIVVGTSVGSLNAAYFASNPTLEGVSKLEKVWEGIKNSDIFPFSLIDTMKGVLSRQNHLISNNGLLRVLQNNIPLKKLEDSKIPLYVVATDVIHGGEVVLSKGPAIRALLASAAIPMIYPPIKFGNHDLIDGGIVNNTPISVAFDLNSTKIFVFPTGYTCARKKPPKSLIEMAMTAFSYMMYRKLNDDIKIYSEKIDLFVAPTLCPLKVKPNDFSRSSYLIKRGYENTKQWAKFLVLDKPPEIKLMPFHKH